MVEAFLEVAVAVACQARGKRVSPLTGTAPSFPIPLHLGNPEANSRPRVGLNHNTTTLVLGFASGFRDAEGWGRMGRRLSEGMLVFENWTRHD